MDKELKAIIASHKGKRWSVSIAVLAIGGTEEEALSDAVKTLAGIADDEAAIQDLDYTAKKLDDKDLR